MIQMGLFMVYVGFNFSFTSYFDSKHQKTATYFMHTDKPGPLIIPGYNRRMNEIQELPDNRYSNREKKGQRCTAFAGQRCIGSGDLLVVARKAKMVLDQGEPDPILIINDATGEWVEVDFRGTSEEVVQRLCASEIADQPASGAPLKRGVGRPKLGVISREVTLLPGHWEWLDGQPNGASAALRRLVHAAKQANRGKDQARQSQDAVYRFMTTMAGNLPGYEEALRAFYRRNLEHFDALIASWPRDIRTHLKKLIAAACNDGRSK